MTSTVSLTRRQLYDLVWSKPMTAIAADFGVSSVAFAKHCKKLDVPQPGRGYWQQLACGLRPARQPLTRAKKGTPTTIELTRREKVEGPRRSDEPVPIVEVREDLRSPHPLISRLRKELGGSTRHGLDLRAISGDGHAVLKVGQGTEKRALLVLDALFKALVARGHDLRFGERYAGSRRYALEAVVGGQEVEFWLIERLEQAAHVETAEETARRATYGSSWAPKFDQTPSGNLILEAASPWDARIRHRWRDSEQQRLEGRLGDVVLGLETIAAAWVEHARQVQQREAAQAREERRHQLSALRAAHLDALAKDLVAMAEAADEAEKVRRFLARVEAKMPEDERSDAFRAWFKWATVHAEHLDPLSRPNGIAKRMAPDLSEAD